MCNGWTFGRVAHSCCTTMRWLSESEKHCQDCLMSTSQLLSCLPRLLDVNNSIAAFSVVVISSALTSGNVPLHTSTQCPSTSLHVTNFTRPSPALVLQQTLHGAKWPGYKVKCNAQPVVKSSPSDTCSSTGYRTVTLVRVHWVRSRQVRHSMQDEIIGAIITHLHIY